MAKKFSDVFGSIRYSKIDPKHNKSHVGGSTDDEEHGAVSSIEFDQQVKHAKKRSMTESESVKRTQTNLKNIEVSKTGYSVDDEQYRKHIERMKKSRDEYIKNNPNSIYAVKKEEFELNEDKATYTIKDKYGNIKHAGRDKDMAYKTHKSLNAKEDGHKLYKNGVATLAEAKLDESLQESAHVYDTKTGKVHSTHDTYRKAINAMNKLNDKHPGYNTPGGLVQDKFGTKRVNEDTLDEASRVESGALFKSLVNKAEASSKAGNHTQAKRHLANAQTARYGIHSKYYDNHHASFGKYKELNKSYTNSDEPVREGVDITSEQIEEAIDHIITARQIIGNSKNVKGGSHEYMKFLKQLRDKFGKEYSTNVHKTAAKLATESVELDEGWGAEPARREAESHAKAYDAVKEKHKRDPVASAILNHIQGMKAEYAEKEATGKGKQSREFWLKDIEKKKARMGNFKNVGVSLNKESTDKKSMFEAIGANASNKTHEGSFQEKDYSKHFTYKKTNDTYAKKHNLPHEIDVGDGVRYGHVKGTVAHIATDENDDGTPKMQKWQIKNHKKWMKESRQADIVREAYMKAKNKKKDEKNDKNVSGKVEKYEADPVLTDTMQKQ